MGSLCCVAAKSDRSNSASQDVSFGPHEPYWRTNTSFSPPSSTLDVHGFVDGISFYGSSTSSNANVCRSPDFSQAPHWTPNEFESATQRDQILKQLPGTSRNVAVGCSFSSCSDNGDTEPNRSFSSKRFFMSKPVHPILYPSENVKETTSDSGDACSWSSGTTSSNDSVDVSERVVDLDNNFTKAQRVGGSSTFKCGLCNRNLSQKSPWGSRSIVRNRDMPITGVLPCQHVFHVECLEQSTPKTHPNDPQCPTCIKQEREHFKSYNVVPNRLKPLCEDDSTSSTRPWGCAQAGDCVENAVNVPPPRNTMMMMINRNQIRKNLSLRGNSSKDSPRKNQEK